MASVYLTRRVTFAAAHRYRRPAWDDAQNEAVFRPCARPNYHGHTYACDLTVTGEMDSRTGFLDDLGLLDRVLASEAIGSERCVGPPGLADCTRAFARRAGGEKQERRGSNDPVRRACLGRPRASRLTS